jgi:biopolymer transport protein ExbD
VNDLAVNLYSRQDDDLAEMSEINVTPFIDVMLVLLVIFMVVAPLSTVDVAVDLPRSTAKPQPRPDKPLYLTVKADLRLSVGNVDVARERLQERLDRETDEDRQRRVFLRADQSVSYGEVMEVMNLLRDAGYLQIALVGLEGGTTVEEGISGTPSGAPASATPAPQKSEGQLVAE